MLIYTYIEAKKDLSKLLDKAKKNNDVFIQSEDSEMFALRFFSKKETAYNLPHTDLELSRDEIVSCIREVRERSS